MSLGTENGGAPVEAVRDRCWVGRSRKELVGAIVDVGVASTVPAASTGSGSFAVSAIGMAVGWSADKPCDMSNDLSNSMLNDMSNGLVDHCCGRCTGRGRERPPARAGGNAREAASAARAGGRSLPRPTPGTAAQRAQGFSEGARRGAQHAPRSEVGGQRGGEHRGDGRGGRWGDVDPEGVGVMRPLGRFGATSDHSGPPAAGKSGYWNGSHSVSNGGGARLVSVSGRSRSRSAAVPSTHQRR